MADQPYPYMYKHPCESCQTGYGFCAQGFAVGSKCCEACSHPTRWEPNPWSAEDLALFERLNNERREADRD